MPSVIESPSGRLPEKAPRWDLTGTEASGGGKVFSWLVLVLGEYSGIYRPKNRVKRPAEGLSRPRCDPILIFGAMALTWIEAHLVVSQEWISLQVHVKKR